jgi:hypothetical protein
MILIFSFMCPVHAMPLPRVLLLAPFVSSEIPSNWCVDCKEAQIVEQVEQHGAYLYCQRNQGRTESSIWLQSGNKYKCLFATDHFCQTDDTSVPDCPVCPPIDEDLGITSKDSEVRLEAARRATLEFFRYFENTSSIRSLDYNLCSSQNKDCFSGNRLFGPNNNTFCEWRDSEIETAEQAYRTDTNNPPIDKSSKIILGIFSYVLATWCIWCFCCPHEASQAEEQPAQENNMPMLLIRAPSPVKDDRMQEQP